jgi:hypothetical protein
MNAETIVCVASGPSLVAEDVEYCCDKARVLVVNDGYRIAPWADWLWACDYGWWKLHEEASRSFAGERWTRDPDAAQRWNLNWIRSAPGKGLACDPALIHEGENGGYQGINFAFHRSPDRILLLGYDMKGLGHWFGHHPQGLQDATDFSARQHHFDRLAADLKSEGVEVINCSRETGLKCFPRARIQEVL